MQCTVMRNNRAGNQGRSGRYVSSVRCESACVGLGIITAWAVPRGSGTHRLLGTFRSSAACLLIGTFLWLGTSDVIAQPAPPGFNPNGTGNFGAGNASPGNSGSVTSEPPVNEEELAKDANTEINVKNADITAIIRIFSKRTKRNFILDDRVKGKVSIYLPGKISTEDSIRILDSVLAYKGFAAVPIGTNLWKILPAKEARAATIPTRTEASKGNPAPIVITRLLQLKYIAADEVRQLLQQLVSPDGFLNAYAGTNSLIIIDTEDNIARLVDIVNTLDVPFTNRDMTIIPIVNAEAADIAQKVNEILGVDAKGDSKGPQTAGDGVELIRARLREAALNAANQAARQSPGMNGMPGQSFSQFGEATSGVTPARVQQPKIIADERTNSVIIVADEDTTTRVRALISQLDSKIDLAGSRFWVYRCQHAKADEIADVLSGLVGNGGGGGSSRSGPEKSDDLISGGLGGGGGSRNTNSRNRGNQFGSTQDRIRGQSRTPGRSRSENAKSSGKGGAVEFSQELSITADPATNSLIIFANKNDYQKIHSLLEKLDIRRRQVLVEATLLEVGLDDSHDSNVSWIASGGGKDGGFLAQNNGSNILSLLQSPQGIQDFSVAAASAGTLTIGGGDRQLTIPTQTILLNAVSANTNVNVLSAPTLLTTDNEQAEIVVGQNVPFVTSSATSDQNLSNTFNQVDRQDVGITLRLTPQISSGDSVTLHIFTEVSSVIATDPKLGPTTAIRTSETSVITKDGQMIVIGGLMSDQINEGDRGVPFLKDIPVFGRLFRNENQRHQRTNLLILITPQVIKDQFDARDTSIRHTDALSRDIEFQGSYPSREEVLHSRNLDRVSSSTPFEGQAPTTMGASEDVTPADSTIKNTPASAIKDPGPTNSDILEFRIDETSSSPGAGDPPSLARKKKNASLGADPSSERPALGLSTDTTPSAPNQISENKSVASRTAAIFLVLQLADARADTSKLPFKVSGQDRVVGIVLPSASNPSVNSFFQMGTVRRYQVADASLSFVPVASFPSVSDAQKLYPSLADEHAWYTLSPYEIMSFGQGPWL